MKDAESRLKSLRADYNTLHEMWEEAEARWQQAEAERDEWKKAHAAEMAGHAESAKVGRRYRQERDEARAGEQRQAAFLSETSADCTALRARAEAAEAEVDCARIMACPRCGHRMTTVLVRAALAEGQDDG